MKRGFCGIYAKNKLPKIKKICGAGNCAFIINSAPSYAIGEHWLLVYCKGKAKTIIWFDPLGRNPTYYGKVFQLWLERTGYKIKEYNSPVQSTQSYYCGLFVLYALYYLSRGVPLETVLKTFSRKNLKENDKIVAAFAWDKFRFDAKKQLVVGFGSKKSINKELILDFNKIYKKWIKILSGKFQYQAIF
jgi:hypothetical protein